MHVVDFPKRAAKRKATTQENPVVEPWVDVAAVARHIGFSYQQTAKLVQQGEIPGRPFRSGKRTYWRFKLSEVDAAIKSGNTQQRVG